MFEGTYSPPFYNDLYNFKDGAQNDIFQDSYISIPVPGPNQTALPVLAVPGSIPTSTAMIGTLTENLPLPSGSPPSSNITASAVPTAQPASTSSQWYEFHLVVWRIKSDLFAVKRSPAPFLDGILTSVLRHRFTGCTRWPNKAVN